jgi:outer membrane protein insertion porin family
VRRRRVAIVLAAFFVGLLLIAAGLFPQEPLRHFVEARLRAAVGPDARVGRLRVIPARLFAEAEDLVVKGPAYSLSVPRLRLSLSAGALFGQATSFRALEVDGARLELRPTQGPAAGAWSQPLAIRHLVVSNATIAYDDASLGGDVTLRGVALRGGLGSGPLEFDVAEAVWSRPQPLRVGPISARLRVSSLLDIEVESFEARTALSRLNAKGSLGRVGAFAPRLSLDGSLDLGETAGVAELPTSSGVVSFTANLGGSSDALEAAAILEGRSLAAAGWPIDRLSARLAHDGARRPVSTLAFDVAMLGGLAKGEARIEGRALSAKLHGERLDAGEIARRTGATFPVDGKLAGEIDLRGDLDRSLDARATLEARAVAATTSMDLRGDVAGTLRPSDRSADLRWTLTADAQGAESAGMPRLSSLAITAAGTTAGNWPPVTEGTIDTQLTLATHSGPASVPSKAAFRAHRGTVAATLDSSPLGGSLHIVAEARGVELDRLTLQADAIDVSPLAAGLKGRLGATASLSGAVDRLSGDGHARVEALAWNTVALGDATLGVEARQGAGHLRLALPSLNVTGEATIPAAAPRAVRGSIALADTSLGPLAPLLSETTPLDGSLSGHVDYELALASPASVRANAQVSHLTLRSGRLSAESSRAFRVLLEDRRFTVEDLDLHGPGYVLTVAGRFGMEEGAPFDVSTSLDADLASVPSPEGWALGGRVESRVALTGTRSDPRATGSFVAREVSAEGPSFPAATVPEARIELVGDALDIPTTRAHLAEGSVTLAGRIPLADLLPGDEGRHQREAQARLRLEWDGLQAAALLARSSKEGTVSPTGALSGRAEVEGDLTSLSSLRGQVALAAADLTVEDMALHVSAAELRLESGRVTTPGITAWTDEGSLQVGGSVDLAKRSMDVTAEGQLELRALSPFVGTASLSGAADVSVSLQGPLSAPRPRGSVWLRDGGARLRDIPEALSAVNGAVHFDGDALRVEETTATLGGGDVRMSGSGQLRGAALSTVSIAITGRNMALRYPAGLRSRIDADLSLRGGSGAFVLAGSVNVPRAVYDLDVALRDGVSAASTEPSPALRAIGLDIRVDIPNPVMVRNNLADLGITGSLTFRGDMEAPAPFGRLEVSPGGRVYVQGRDFPVESGSFVYDGDWNPTVSLKAKRALSDSDTLDTYEVRLEAEGPLESVQPTLHADGLSDAEAFSLVATGHAKSGALSAGARVAGEGAASLVVGRLSRSLGLDEVAIQPELLARETEQPGTRFTFGKQLTKAISLIYSVGLAGPEQRFIQLEARLRRNVTAKVQRQDDGTITYGAGQRMRLGGSRRPPPPVIDEKVRLSEARLEGELPLPEEKLRDALKSAAGKKVTPWSVQEDADRLRERLVGEGFIEAEVGARLEGDTAVFRVRSGPRFVWKVSGMDHPPDLTDEIRKALFAEEAIDRGRDRILGELRRRGHQRAKVTARSVEEARERVLTFEATPGPRLEAEVRFPGASALSTAELLEAAGGPAEILTSFKPAARRIEEAYAKRHFLAARLGTPQVEESAGRVRITWPVTEGEPARIAAVRFDGASRPNEELTRATGIAPGMLLSEARVAGAVETLRGDYFGHGYPRARVNAEMVVEGADAAIVFHIVEGDRVEVGGIEVVGLRRTRESMVRRRIHLEPGDPLDPRQLAVVERHVLELGTFSRVAVTASDGSPALVRVEVEENPLLTASYDFRYSDERKATALVDAEIQDLLGVGLDVGVRYTVGRDIREQRGSVFLPSVIARGSLTGSVFRLEEDLAATDPFTGEPFINVRLQRGFQVQQAVPLPSRWNLLLGYRFKRVSSTAFPEPISIAGLDTSFVRDTRDNPLDARRGRFLSLNVTYSPTSLGSDFAFVKGFAQAFVSRSFGESWTWAQGYRLGLAHGFEGQSLVSSERFNAGGANSLRGFAADSVGPRDFLGPTGGEAVVIANEELRYHHPSRVGAAIFYDVGNVFATVGEMRLELRHTLGFGLRWVSPVGLLRVDLGFPLNREEGDKAYRFFFSLGQAF